MFILNKILKIISIQSLELWKLEEKKKCKASFFSKVLFLYFLKTRFLRTDHFLLIIFKETSRGNEKFKKYRFKKLLINDLYRPLMF